MNYARASRRRRRVCDEQPGRDAGEKPKHVEKGHQLKRVGIIQEKRWTQRARRGGDSRQHHFGGSGMYSLTPVTRAGKNISGFSHSISLETPRDSCWKPLSKIQKRTSARPRWLTSTQPRVTKRLIAIWRTRIALYHARARARVKTRPYFLTHDYQRRRRWRFIRRPRFGFTQRRH